MSPEKADSAMSTSEGQNGTMYTHEEAQMLSLKMSSANERKYAFVTQINKEENNISRENNNMRGGARCGNGAAREKGEETNGHTWYNKENICGPHVQAHMSSRKSSAA